MRNRWIVAGAAALALGATTPASAWDEVGHRVIARIAWDNMSPQARHGAVRLLMEAPADAGIRALLPRDGRAAEVRERELFLRAAVWADYVRSNPEYHRGDWHYINIFWEQSATGRPRDRPDIPMAGQAVTKLEEFSRTVADPAIPAAERAVQLAWILHVVGDIHQPMHASARISPRNPEGDRGGNLHRIAGSSDNLHSYWDRAVTRQARWGPGDVDVTAFIGSAARSLQSRNPLPTSAEMDPMEWARESYRIARDQAYPGSLRWREVSPPSYEALTERIATRRATLAGYRLAELLNRRFGEEAGE